MFCVNPQSVLQALSSIVNTGDAALSGLAATIRSGDYSSLQGSSIDWTSFSSFAEAQKAFIANELLRKADFLPGLTSEMRKEAALKGARESEVRNSETNRRIRTTWPDLLDPRHDRIVARAQRFLVQWLGDFELEEVFRHCRWGPGSDLSNRRPFISPYHKFARRLTATSSAMPFLSSYMEFNPVWGRWLSAREDFGPFSPLGVKIVRGNRLTTVLKDAWKDRVICVEPPVNVYFQLGLGSVFKKRLRGAGTDLFTGQVENRWYALLGSYLRDIATIDLSSASDLNALGLVTHLFDHPRLLPWLKAMDMLRSPFTNGVLQHKFSSMGNGFTFELETLIFLAICRSVAVEDNGRVYAVYGDDIIVSSNIYDAVREALVLIGHKPNERKSFATGPYRESCGMNAYDGRELDVYRCTTMESLSDLYSLRNGLRRLGFSRYGELDKLIPKSLRFYGPIGTPSTGPDVFKQTDAVLHTDDITQVKSLKLHGLQDQWFFWTASVKCLQWESKKGTSTFLEPAILHSFMTMVPDFVERRLTGGTTSGMRPQDFASFAKIFKHGPVGARWGSGGEFTLSSGEWKVGRAMISRHLLGNLRVTGDDGSS